MFKGLLGGVWDILKFLFVGIMAVCFFTYACTQRAITSAGENTVSLSQLNMNEPTFNTKDYGSMVDVTADATVSPQHEVRDFKATLRLYDCPTADADVASCKDLGSDYKLFDGDIKAGASQAVSWVFNFYDVPARTGTLVSKLEITDPRG